MAIPRFKLTNIGSLILIEYVPAFAVPTFNISGQGFIDAVSIAIAAG
jgi:hypothetical protein